MLKTVSLFLALLASTALADNHGWQHKPTTWKVKVGGAELKYDPPFVHAQKGDTVRFVFLEKNHTATQSTFEEPCRKAGFDSGFRPSTGLAGAPTWDLKIHDSKKPIWVYCRQPGAGPKTHCQSGMVFAVNPDNHGHKSFANFKKRAEKSTAQNKNNNSGKWHNKVSAAAADSSYVEDTYGDDNYGDDAYDNDEDEEYPTSTTAYTPEPTHTGAYEAPRTTHHVSVGGLKADGTPDLTFRPPFVKAGAGDIIKFQFGPANHTATVSSFDEPCKRNFQEFDSGFMPVAGSPGIQLESTFTVKDTKPIWMYCRQPGAGPKTHCQAGMVFAVNPPEGKFDEFKKKAETSTTQTSTTSSSAGVSALGALGGGDDSEDSANLEKLVSYAPIALGLLGGTVALGVILLALTSLLFIRSRRAERTAAYKPIVLGSGREKSPPVGEESYEYTGSAGPTGRYQDGGN